MRRLLPAIATLCLLAAPSTALAKAAVPASVTHQAVQAAGLAADFAFSAPQKGLYTCEMHPGYTSSKPGACPTCGMSLEKQTRTIAVTVRDAKHQLVAAKQLRLDVKNADGEVQELFLKGNGRYEGAFCLKPGAYDVTASLTPGGQQAPASFHTRYTVK